MKNFRKEQLRLAVLLEISKEPKKNGEIIKAAEKRLVLDDEYNRLMQNGKQTIGSKEMQFALYYIKRDGMADLPSRGMYKENSTTITERTGVIKAVLAEIEADKSAKVILTAETLEAIRKMDKESSKVTEKGEKAADVPQVKDEDKPTESKPKSKKSVKAGKEKAAVAEQAHN